MRLIDDLFPGVPVSQGKDLKFESIIRKCIKKESLQEEEGFILKAIQLRAILEVY